MHVLLQSLNLTWFPLVKLAVDLGSRVGQVIRAILITEGKESMFLHETTNQTARTVSWISAVLLFPLSLTMHFYVKPSLKGQASSSKTNERLATLQRRIERIED